MGRMLKLLVALVALVALLVVVAIFYLDTIARWGLETAIEQALGVEATVGSVAVRPLRGTLRVNDLEIANPAGFQKPHFLTLRELSGAIDLASLRSDPMVVSGVRLEGLDLTLELQGTKTNYGVILKKVGSEPAPSEPAADESEDAGPSLRIDELVLSEIGAHARLPAGGRDLSLQIPEIRLTNLGGESGGIELAELVQRIVRELLAAVSRQKGLPQQMLTDLGQQLGQQAGQKLGDAGRVGKGLSEGARGVVEGIGGLFRSKKDDR